jgi:hypothetical protein
MLMLRREKRVHEGSKSLLKKSTIALNFYPAFSPAFGFCGPRPSVITQENRRVLKN